MLYGLQILIRLLVAYVDPATEAARTARQCLSVFFPAYAGFSARHHRLLCTAAVPAARRALHVGSSAACRAAAPNVLRFTMQLLQVSHSIIALVCLRDPYRCWYYWNTLSQPALLRKVKQTLEDDPLNLLKARLSLLVTISYQTVNLFIQ